MSHGSKSRMLKRLSASAVFLIVLASVAFPQQNTGSIKGTVTDQLGGLIVNATVFAKDVKGGERKATTNSAGIYEFKSFAPGYYDLRVVAPGFNVYEQKKVEVKSVHATILDLQLSVESLEQSVTIDNRKGVTTDSDRNADAIILR